MPTTREILRVVGTDKVWGAPWLRVELIVEFATRRKKNEEPS